MAEPDARDLVHSAVTFPPEIVRLSILDVEFDVPEHADLRRAYHGCVQRNSDWYIWFRTWDTELHSHRVQRDRELHNP
jgi:hypothetical protein